MGKHRDHTPVLRAEFQRSAGDGRGGPVRPIQPPLFSTAGQPGQQLQVGQGVVKTSTGAAENVEPAVSPVLTQPDGGHGIGVVLLLGQTHQMGHTGRLRHGIKVPHHQVGLQSVLLQPGVTAVGGDKQVPLFRRRQNIYPLTRADDIAISTSHGFFLTLCRDIRVFSGFLCAQFMLFILTHSAPRRKPPYFLVKKYLTDRGLVDKITFKLFYLKIFN